MNPEVAIRAVQTPDELRMAHELFASAHGGDYATAMRWLEGSGACYPGFLREHTRVALRNGEVVGGLRLVTDTVRLGEARLKMGGIGWVTTAPRHRRKGIYRLLLEDALAYMRQHSYHIAMLFGNAELYRRFGFSAVLPDYAVVLDTLEALGFEVPFRLRPARPGDVRGLQKIHHANDQGVACSVVRNAAHFASKWERYPGFQVLLDDAGRLMAYFLAYAEAGHLCVAEAGLTEYGVAAGVVGACARLAAEATLSTVRFLVPPLHPLARYLLQFRSRHEMGVNARSGGMLAFITIGETLEHLIPEWEALLARSALRDLRTEVTFFVGGSFYRVRANRGAIDVAAMPGSSKIALGETELMQLVTGYRPVEDILETSRSLIHPDARALLSALCPKRSAYVWPFDRF